MTIFLEDDGIREVVLGVKGVGTAPEGKPRETPAP